MPEQSYKLTSAGITIKPTNPSSFPTHVRIVDENTDDECLALESQGLTIYVDFDELPLIVEAASMLLRLKQINKKHHQLLPSDYVSQEFLDAISFRPINAKNVLNGCIEDLDCSFVWTETFQGSDYWRAIHDGERPLTKTDKALLHLWVESAEYHKNSQAPCQEQ